MKPRVFPLLETSEKTHRNKQPDLICVGDLNA